MTLPDGVFKVRRKIRFSDSDPAGIVFYAEYFRMFSDLFEDWLIEVLGISFADQFLVEQRMFPLVHVDVDFKTARKMGDAVELSLLLTGIGRSSIRYDIIGLDGDLEILRGSFVTCMASKKTTSTIEIPADIRGPLERYLAVCRKAA